MKFTAEEIKQLVYRNRTDIFYNSWEWRTLSAEVKKEHHYECLMCKEQGRYTRAVIVHHVKHLREYPELAYDKYYIDQYGHKQLQLIPVCLDCHNAIHGHANSVDTRFINKEKW